MDSDKASLPLYMQTTEMLIREITSGRLLEGEKLPPEREMASDLGIAVGTLRKALDALVAQGLLERVQGSGNYVRQNADVTSIYAFFRLELLEGGGLPTARVLSAERRQKPDDLPSFGQSGGGHRIRRVRLLSGQPSAIEEIWLDGKWADRIGSETLPDALYNYYQKSLGLLITKVEDTVGVARLPDWTPSEIGCTSQEVAGYVERRSRTSNGEIVEFSRTWFNPDRVRYVARYK